MTEKQKTALEKIIDATAESSRGNFREIAEYAISLGYMPVLKGTRKDYADFTSLKTKRTILKIKTDYKFPPTLAIKFFALPEYNGIFKRAIDFRFSEWQRLGYKARCFGCGKCDGTQGYKLTTPSGEQGFLCGYGLLDLPALSSEDIPEIKAALKLQDDFFLSLK